MRILVVDDSPIQRKIACYCLSEFGEIIESGSLQETISLYMKSLREKKPFDFVALDYHLNDGTGQDVVIKMRNMEKAFKVEACKIVYVTASLDEEGILEHCSENEVTLMKPINAEKIIEKLKALSLPFETKK
ncbi:response regulator [bacterium]|nr:response regulator [bacterium]